MSSRRARMVEDLRIRNAARAVVDADIENLRSDLAHKGVGARLFGRVSETAQVVYEEAVDVASDNKGALAAIAAALVLWFARNPIRDAIFDEDHDDYEDE